MFFIHQHHINHIKCARLTLGLLVALLLHVTLGLLVALLLHVFVALKAIWFLTVLCVLKLIQWKSPCGQTAA